MNTSLRSDWLAAAAAALASLSATAATPPVSISEADYEGRSQWRVTTPTATWYYDRAGGGFSRLLDRDGRDWISFHKDPLKKTPESAAAGFRGLPNLGFGDPENGAGHAGFDLCTSRAEGPATLRTSSNSGRLEWEWTFDGSLAHFRMCKDPGELPWWFLYEGTIGGRWSPATHYWGTNQGGPNREKPTSGRQLFDRWRWIYFGDDASPRVLFLAQLRPDDLADTLWYMGAGPGAAITSADGMVVFGFGRGQKTPRQLFRGTDPEFIVGFIEQPARDGAGHARIKNEIERHLAAARHSPP